MSLDLFKIPVEEASILLFKGCVELILKGNHSHLINSDMKRLTQRLYGDYRALHQTDEYKRAVKHVKHFKSTGLGKELF